VDLGGRATKAVHMQRKGDTYTLLRYVLMDAPIYEKSMSVDLLSEHLKAVTHALEAKTRQVSLAVGVNESVIRHAELPPIPPADMRMILKNNTKNYLQQDLPGHVFDCHIQSAIIPNPADKAKPGAGAPKSKVLVAGAKETTGE